MKFLYSEQFKLFFRIAVLLGFACFIGFGWAVPFQDVVTVFWDFLGEALIAVGLMYLMGCLFFIRRKGVWFKALLGTGLLILLIGCIIYYLFYGYAADNAEWNYIENR